ncbi:MAG: hypothetical protein K2K95_06555, partial [Muribaculaceae bacterium]|nr:hypothetical protein [Muribaculaceae bacterium]
SSDLSDDSVVSSDLSDTSVSSDGNMELEALRSEVNELKRLLANSRITNEKVLRKAMNAKSGWLDRLVKLEIFSLPLITLIFMAFSAAVGASMWPIAAIIVIGGISTWLDWYTLRIAPASILDMPMMQLKANLIRQKKYRMIQTVAESVVTFLWLCWYVYSIKSVLSPDDELDNILKYSIFGGSFVGGIISVFVIIWIYKKAQNTNNDLIDSIDSNYDVG